MHVAVPAPSHSLAYTAGLGFCMLQWPFLVLHLTSTLVSTGWGYSKGHITDDMIRTQLPGPSDDTMVLMCGPPPMIENACIPNLHKLGYAQDMLFAYWVCWSITSEVLMAMHVYCNGTPVSVECCEKSNRLNHEQHLGWTNGRKGEIMFNFFCFWVFFFFWNYILL